MYTIYTYVLYNNIPNYVDHMPNKAYIACSFSPTYPAWITLAPLCHCADKVCCCLRIGKVDEVIFMLCIMGSPTPDWMFCGVFLLSSCKRRYRDPTCKQMAFEVLHRRLHNDVATAVRRHSPYQAIIDKPLVSATN